jgi:hypothetical protein
MGVWSWEYCRQRKCCSTGKIWIWVTVYRTWTSLWHLSSSCQERCQGLDRHHIKHWESLTGLRQAKETRTLCQKNKETGEFKQKPVMVGGRTTYRTLSLKRTLFQNGTDRQSYLQKVPKKRWISHTHPMQVWGHSLLKISSPGPLLYGTKRLSWCPISRILYFIQSAGLLKG